MAPARTCREREARERIATPIVVVILSLSSAVAVAQVLPKERPDAGRILEQTREPLRLPPPAEDDVRPRSPEPKPAPPVSPTLKVRVTQFNFSGNTLFSDEQLRVVVQEFIGKELDFEGLSDAATKAGRANSSSVQVPPGKAITKHRKQTWRSAIRASGCRR